MRTTECQAGCKLFSGNEVHHHRDCVYYPESNSRRLDEALADNTRLQRELEEKLHAINDAHSDSAALQYENERFRKALEEIKDLVPSHYVYHQIADKALNPPAESNGEDLPF